MGQYLDELFADRKSDYDVRKKRFALKIDWKKYESEFTEVEMACFRLFSRIAFYYLRKLFYELFEGFHLDVEHKTINTEQDLFHHCDLLAG